MDTLSQILTANCKKVKENKEWKSISKIVGEAVEDCVTTLACPICKEYGLVKYKANEKSKDIKCEKCNCQIQIKAKKGKKNNGEPLKLLGAEYKTTYNSIKENTVHYLVVLYSSIGDSYTVHDILFIHCTNINERCIIPRPPLKDTAKRAGWQGCILVFDTFNSLQLSV